MSVTLKRIARAGWVVAIRYLSPAIALALCATVARGQEKEATSSESEAAWAKPRDRFHDEYGIYAPYDANMPGRRFPASADFPTGPAVGERLPDFTLKNQKGETIDFHPSRDGHKAAVVFYRSVVW